jgi:hypothetical protein
MLKRRCERGKWPGILKPLLKRCNGREPGSRLVALYAIHGSVAGVGTATTDRAGPRTGTVE